IRTVQGSNHNVIKGYLYDKGAMYYSKVIDVDILDRIGTGDDYTCGIIDGELSNMDPQDTVTFSTTSSVLSYTISEYTSLFNTDDIIKFINNEKNDIER